MRVKLAETMTQRNPLAINDDAITWIGQVLNDAQQGEHVPAENFEDGAGKTTRCVLSHHHQPRAPEVTE